MAGPVSDTSNVRQTVLPGGLLFLSERLPHIRSVALGLAYGVGGRDDPPGSEGLAHFFEHMVFKGTPDRTARDISFEAESLGAELNAFTEKEQTCFVGRFPGDKQAEVTALLAGIVAAPAFRAEETEREKSVIREEIQTAEDDPDSKAADLVYRALYGSHALGAPVTGTPEAVAAFEPDGLRRLYGERYHAGSGMAVAVGDVRHDETADILARLVPARRLSGADRRSGPGPAERPVLVHTRPELTQVYVCLALPAFAFGDERRYALSVLNAALGGGMSSRLFQRLREDEGLVYSVSSFVELHGDTGFVGIYFVADRRKSDRCFDVLREELGRLRRDRVGADEFERAVNMVRSSVVLGLESPLNRMLRLARTQLLLGRFLTVDETLEAYGRLTLDEVNGLIEQVLGDEPFHAGAVGPIAPEELSGLVAGLAD